MQALRKAQVGSHPPPRLSPGLVSLQDGWAAWALLQSQGQINCDVTDSGANGGVRCVTRPGKRADLPPVEP